MGKQEIALIHKFSIPLSRKNKEVLLACAVPVHKVTSCSGVSKQSDFMTGAAHASIYFFVFLLNRILNLFMIPVKGLV